MAYTLSNSKSFMRCPKFYDALSLTIMIKGVHLRITFYSANKAALALNDPNKKQLDKFSKNNSVINFKRICRLFQQDFKDFTKHASLQYWDIRPMGVYYKHLPKVRNCLTKNHEDFQVVIEIVVYTCVYYDLYASSP